MNTTKGAEYATMGSFGLAIIVAIYEFWPSITGRGWLLSKLVFLLVCIGVLFSLVVVYKSLQQKVRATALTEAPISTETKPLRTRVAKIRIVVASICVTAFAAFVIYRSTLAP